MESQCWSRTETAARVRRTTSRPGWPTLVGGAVVLLGLALLLLLAVSCARQGAPGPEEGAGNQSREQREAPARTAAGEESTGPAEATAREECVAERTGGESAGHPEKEKRAARPAGEGGFTAAPEAAHGLLIEELALLQGFAGSAVECTAHHADCTEPQGAV